MQIRFNCPTPGCFAYIQLEPFEECGGRIRCPRCHTEHAVTITDSMRQAKQLDRCAACGAQEMFTRKDFPQKLGLLVVLVAGIAAIVYFQIDLRIAYAILAAAVLIDLALYLMVGKVTSCYACRAEYRGVSQNPKHEAFDLATAEKY